jgi:DNA-binding IclR family transcriptional regulator
MTTTPTTRPERSDTGANSVLGKVRLILEAFGPDDEHISLTEITRRSGVPKASVHRLAQELLQWGLLERHGSDYWLGMRLFEIGQRVPRQRILRDAARPYMEDLYQATNETIHLAGQDGLEVLYLEKVSGLGQVTRPVPSRVAGRMPLHCTATGKVLLAFGPRRVVEEVLATPLTRITRFTVAGPGLLLDELARPARQRHVAARPRGRNCPSGRRRNSRWPGELHRPRGRRSVAGEELSLRP